MATEFSQRPAAPQRGQSRERTLSGARPRLERAEAWSDRPGRGRPSTRPSAFGLPPVSARPAPGPTPPAAIAERARKRLNTPPRTSAPAPVELPTTPSASAQSEQQTPADVPALAIKTDIEELLPISQVKSLPRPPRVPTFDSQPPPPPRAKRFPWASLSVFATVLIASGITLLHYRDLGAVTSRATAAQPAATARERMQIEGHERSAPERIERTLASQPAQLRLALLEEGDRALAAQDERVAELLFARARELPGDRSMAAYGLARVRLAQSDLEGAEGWLLVAIEEQPRRAAYHALYADLLERRGRGSDAELERALARSLAQFAEETGTR